MKIPSKKICFQMIRDMKMMDHIVAHSVRVCQVACLLVDQLNESGSHLNRDMVQAAALLHDITKTRSFETQESHAETAKALIREAGYSEVGQVVGQHVQLLQYYNPDGFHEAEILNYSDKRVLHDQVVSLEERFDYIAERYAQSPSDQERVRLLTEKTKTLEKRLFNHLSFMPALLEKQLDSEDYTADLNAFFSDRINRIDRIHLSI